MPANMIDVQPGERVVCVVFGESTAENQRVFNSMLRMPTARFIVIGREEPFLATYRAASWGMPLEVYDEGTLPPSGVEVIVLKAGRTTLMMNWSAANTTIPEDERLITIEDTPEIRLRREQ